MTACIFLGCLMLFHYILHVSGKFRSWELEGMFLHWFEYGRLLILKAIKTYAFVFLNI